jgi:hypothetical protein
MNDEWFSVNFDHQTNFSVLGFSRDKKKSFFYYSYACEKKIFSSPLFSLPPSVVQWILNGISRGVFYSKNFSVLQKQFFTDKIKINHWMDCV